MVKWRETSFWNVYSLLKVDWFCPPNKNLSVGLKRELQHNLYLNEWKNELILMVIYLYISYIYKEIYSFFDSPAGPVGVWCSSRWANLATVTGTAGSSSQYCSLLFILIDTIYIYDIWWYIYIKISVAIVDVQPDGRTCSHFRDCCPDYRQYCGHRAHKQGKLYHIIYNCINIYIYYIIYINYISYILMIYTEILMIWYTIMILLYFRAKILVMVVFWWKKIIRGKRSSLYPS